MECVRVRRISALQAAMAEEVLAPLELEGTERILDVGCGNGKTTAEIAARVPQGTVVGVDASADRIARRRHFRAVDQHLPEADRLVFAIDVLDPYQSAACDAPGEENYFRFYQMDITLEPR